MRKNASPHLASVRSLLIHVIFVMTRWEDVSCGFIIPGLPGKQFVKLGDINFGALLPMSAYDREKRCSDKMSKAAVHYTQGIEYAVDKVNARHQLPGNVTLGFVVLDDCYKVNVAVAQALAFVPQIRCQAQETPYRAKDDVMEAYDVVAVVGSSLSSQSVAVAHVLGPAQVPQVSFFSTSDDLSDKTHFPYFLRTTPPDRFQIQAIFSLIDMFGWSYVSVIYMEGSYGENAFQQLRHLFHSRGICLAAVHKARDVAASLVLHKNARAVVIITAHTNAHKLIYEAGKLVPAGTFTWIGTDAWARSLSLMQDLGHTLLDTLYAMTLTAHVPDYDQYFQQLRLADTHDPWFAEFWDDFFNCSAANGTCASNKTIGTSGLPYPKNPFSGHLQDTISVVTSAVSRVLQSPECAGLVQSAARHCVTGPRLLNELMATRQSGYTGWIELDSNRDRLGRYVIKQVVPAVGQSSEAVYSQVTLTEFDALINEMNLVRNVSWYHNQGLSGQGHPLSRCSSPCRPHHAQVVQEVTCCWLCQPCRLNERLILGGTRCDPCPTFTWPDPESANTTCQAIGPDKPRIDSVIGGVQAAVGLTSFILCFLVCIFFHRHRHRRVIKASSQELSLLMLLAIALGYLTMVTLLASPTDLTCRINFLLFCVSFTLIYAPLFVRALRIFRIFAASKRSAQQPRLIDSTHQLIFTFALLFIQVVMCSVVMVLYPNWQKMTQSSRQERYVELTCDLPLSGLASFLAYNLLLVASCTLLAFKTRHLPDNFNESRFISMCVSTTLLILICFIPAYLVASRELLKMLMLALALALNHSVALVFLFLPKIYAVLEGAARMITMPSQNGRGISVFTTSSNIVSSSANDGHALTGERRESGDRRSTAAVKTGAGLTKPRTSLLQVCPVTYSTSAI